MRQVVFVYPIIRTQYIEKSLETLFRYTDPEKFRVIVVDQSIEGLSEHWRLFLYETGHLYLRMKNQGFAKAANEGIIHALRWEVPYISIVNDDTEFMYEDWWEDLLLEFDTDPQIIAVCPESPRVPLWGYGRPHNEAIDILPYKEEYSKEDIAFLKSGDYDSLKDRYPLEPLDLPIDPAEGKPNWAGKIYIPVERRPGQPNQGEPVFPLTKRGVIDAIAMWMPVFKREGLIELGLFDERFVWGGGEDYDMNTRAYTCAWPVERDVCDPAFHRRMVSTMKSWVWHWWGKSKDVKQELDPKLFEDKEPWNNTDELWPPEINQGRHMDVWGHPPDSNNPEAPRVPLKRNPVVKVKSL
jgi:GT2 family glycosyltransferase